MVSDKVNILITTYKVPSRKLRLKNLLNSLIKNDLVDNIYLYLNEPYQDIEDDLLSLFNHFKIKYKIGTDYKNFGKYWWENSENNVSGYIFHLDDDMVIKDDYIQVSIENLKRYNNRVIMSYSGKQFLKYPITGLSKNEKNIDFISFGVPKEVERDYQLDYINCSKFFYHTDYVRIELKNILKFLENNNITIPFSDDTANSAYLRSLNKIIIYPKRSHHIISNEMNMSVSMRNVGNDPNRIILINKYIKDGFIKENLKFKINQVKFKSLM